MTPPIDPSPSCGFGCDVHFEAAARVGIANTPEPGNQSSDNLGDDPPPFGNGLFLDAEAGVRSGRFTFAVFASYVGIPELDSSGSTGNVSCVGADTIDESLVNGGARVHVHFGPGFFAGVSIGIENASKTTTCVATGMAIAVSAANSFYELHLGYTLPKLGPVALQIYAATTVGDGTYPTQTNRLALGVQF